ncbi:acyltransferase family protein [Mucilaginibacter sp.]
MKEHNLNTLSLEGLGINSKKRVLWIDYAKFIGIFLVVFGHQALPDTWGGTVFAFHMPLFFFISGFLFSFKKYNKYSVFFKKRIIQLIVPYFIFNVITYIFWLFIGRKFGADSTRVISIYTPVIGIFYGNGIKDYLVHGIALWFLPCLFVTENIFFMVFKNKTVKTKWFLLACIALLGYLDYKYNPIRLPWSFDVAVVATTIYGVGNLTKDIINKLMNLKTLVLAFVFVISTLLLLYIASINLVVNMNNNNYGNYLLFLLGAFSGVISVFSLSRILEISFGKVNFVEYIAQNTLVIIAFQFIAMSSIKGFMYYCLKYPLSILDGNVLLGFAITISVIIILVPVMYLSNKYLPIMVGKDKKYII